MKCSTPTPFPLFGVFQQHTHRGLLRLAAQVYSHKVNNSKAFFMAKMDLSFLFSQHSSSSIVHWHSQPLSRSLVGLVSILSEAHEDICWWASIREHPLLWTLCFDKTFTIMLLSKSRQENWQFLTRLKITKCCLLYWRPEKNGAVIYLFSYSLF